MMEERASEEYKRVVDPPRDMKKSMTGLPNQSKRPQTDSSFVTHFGNIIDASPSNY